MAEAKRLFSKWTVEAIFQELVLFTAYNPNAPFGTGFFEGDLAEVTSGLQGRPTVYFQEALSEGHFLLAMADYGLLS
eukprot:CAMPEP_0194703842 /NCGR_PEP_ID=MMETSP0295-20121207/27858_1 /TAXON_ID=39354 /ORGANISM="Heterosigma akashiwo, Strain CCMP2393" /LENGTH=76 /DNA_ID=CAMNT_0039598973 /DNA_START=287 /DNA_END=514 /DNA_ORIENTATION=+